MTKYSTRAIVAAFLAAAILTGASAAASGQDAVQTGNSYVLGPNDQITIRALDAEELSDKTYRVGQDGDLTLPMIGRVKAVGFTAGQLESELAGKLEKYIRHPKVAVTVRGELFQGIGIGRGIWTATSRVVYQRLICAAVYFSRRSPVGCRTDGHCVAPAGMGNPAAARRQDGPTGTGQRCRGAAEGRTAGTESRTKHHDAAE